MNKIECKGLHVNTRKTKFMISGVGLGKLRDSGAYIYAVCRSGVGANSIFCSLCSLWVYKNTAALLID